MDVQTVDTGQTAFGLWTDGFGLWTGRCLDYLQTGSDCGQTADSKINGVVMSKLSSSSIHSVSVACCILCVYAIVSVLVWSMFIPMRTVGLRFLVTMNLRR